MIPADLKPIIRVSFTMTRDDFYLLMYLKAPSVIDGCMKMGGGRGIGGKSKKRSDTRLYIFVGVYVPSVIHWHATRELQ